MKKTSGGKNPNGTFPKLKGPSYMVSLIAPVGVSMFVRLPLQYEWNINSHNNLWNKK